MSRFRRSWLASAKRFQIAEVAKADWSLFLESAVGSSTFSSVEWVQDAAQAMETQASESRATGAQARFLGAWDGDRLLAGVAGVVSGKGWRQRFSTPPLFPHTGILYRPLATNRPAHIESERSAATAALVDSLCRQFTRTHLTHTPAFTDTREFLWAGWDVQPRYTYHIDLPDDRSKVWDGFERRTRTAVRKAEKTGFHVEPATDVTELRRLYGLVYGGEHNAPVPGATLQHLTELAAAGGRVQGWQCLAPTGETASVVFFVADGDTLCAWVAGANPDHRDSGATSLIYWHVLQTTSCRRFDFVGANLASIAFFKRGFGGNLVPYFSTEGFGSSGLRTLAGLQRAVRRS